MAMQQSTDKQLDDQVSGKIDQTVPRTTRSILSTNLNPMAFKKSKSRKSQNTSSISDGNIDLTITECEKQQAIPLAPFAPNPMPQICIATSTNFC